MKKGQKIHSLKLKKQAIADLESEQETKESLQLKYGISKLTVNNWKRQIRYSKDGYNGKAIIAESDKRKAVREVLSGLITEKEAIVKYGVRTRRSIKIWIK